MLEVASILEGNSAVSWLFTAGIAEACAVRSAGSTKPILALAYTDGLLSKAIEHNIDVTVYDYATVQALDTCAAQFKKKARVHIKVDTGMSRLGLLPHEVMEFITYVQENYKNIELYGIFTHCADTNNTDLSYTNTQLLLFDTLLEQLKSAHITIPCVHALASGALFLPQKYPMVRVGTALYGFWKSDVQKKRFLACDPEFTLYPVLTWKAHVIHVKSGCAVVSVGYADGYPRDLMHNAHVIINGCAAPVLTLYMNTMVVDIATIADVQVGTQVVVVGDYPGITATDLAQKLGTINNEIVTRISPTITRYVVP